MFQDMIMEAFRLKPRMSVAQIREELGLTVKQANNALTRLSHSGKIRHVDNGVYQVPIPIVVKPSPTAWGIAMSLLSPIAYVPPKEKDVPLCAYCGKEFKPKVHNSKTCSTECSNKMRNRSRAQRRKAQRKEAREEKP